MTDKKLTTFLIEDRKLQRLKMKALSEKTSMAEILNKAIDLYLGKEDRVVTRIKLEAGYEVTKRDKTNGDITQADLKEISIMPEENTKTEKEKKIEALRDLIGGVSPVSPAENIQDIPAEDFPEEEVSYTEDKQ